MADISKIVLGGNTYNIKDTVARAAAVGGMHFLGVSLSPIADDTANIAIIKTNSGTNTANRYYTGTAPTGTTGTYSGVTYTLKNVKLIAGDVVIFRDLEFVFSDSDSKWHELGSTGTLGGLAYKSNVSVTYKKATGGTLVGTKATISVSGSTSEVKVDSHSYTPEGTISGDVTNGTPDTKKISSGVTTSQLATTILHDTPTLDAPTDSVTADTVDVATANATATSVLTGLTGTKTFVTSAVNASYANETLTLSAADTGTVTASNANLTGVSGTKTVLSKLTGITTFVKSATLTAGTVTTVATGKVDPNGGGATVATGSSGEIYAITGLGKPTFTGSFSGTEATIAHTVSQGTVTASGTYTPAGSVTITNTDTTVTGS